MQRALLLNVVICERAAILQLFASEDEALLIWRDALLVLNFGLKGETNCFLTRSFHTHCVLTSI